MNSTTPLGTLDQSPTASAARYLTPAGASEIRRAAVVLVPGRDLLRIANGALRPLAVQGEPTNPIFFVPGKDVTVVVHLRPDGTPYLEPTWGECHSPRVVQRPREEARGTGPGRSGLRFPVRSEVPLDCGGLIVVARSGLSA
jgi:hypothetical protein